MSKLGKKKRGFFLAAASFGLATLVLCAIYAWFDLFPFGEKTLAWGDMKQQVIPLMLEFKDILAGKTGFLLNFQNAGGMSFWGVFFFFLSSPFTFLMAFVEKADVYFLVNVLVLCKLSLAAASASWFFGEEQPDLDPGAHLFLSVSYGLCGYGLLYYQNIVWLDVLYLFPVLMTGFHRTVYQGKSFLFTASLTAVLAVNYYLSYMVLLALILMGGFFVKNCVLKNYVFKERRGEISGKIGLSAVTALLLTSLAWLPSLLQCLHSARTAQSLVETIQGGGFFTETGTSLPVLLCTGAAIAVPVLALLFPSSPKRKTLLQLLFLTSLPLIIEPINKLWHTGSYQAFPARYGYIPLFLALWYTADLLGDPAFSKVKTSKRSGAAMLAALACLAGAGAVVLALDFPGITSYTQTLWFDEESLSALLGFSLIAVGIVLLGFLLLRKRRISRRVLGWALLALCLVQGGYHGAVLLGAPANTAENGRKLLAMEEQTPGDSGFYRVKQAYKFCDVNLLGGLGAPTLNHYTSLTDESFLHAVKKLGYSSYWMETSACCGTAFTDVLLSNKYVLTSALGWGETGAKNLGYLLPAESLPEALPDGDRMLAQQELSNHILNALGEEGGSMFRPCAPKEKQGVEITKSREITKVHGGQGGVLRYKIPVGEEELLYFDAFCENTNSLREKINDSFRVLVNGEEAAESYPDQNRNGILCLGRFQNETVRIDVEVKKEGEFRSFGVWGLRTGKLKAFTDRLHTADLHAENSRILGTARAEEGESLFLSIPYADGMEVTVNGKAVKLRKVLDCFLEIPLEPGENQIELTYLPPGVKAVAALTALGILLALTLWLFWKKGFGKRAFALWYKIAGPLLNAACWAVFIAIYLAPVLLWLGGLA